MTSFAKAFEPSRPGRRGARPEAGDPRLGHSIGKAGDERRLGPDDDEVDGLVAGRRNQPFVVVGRSDGQQPWRRASMPGLPGAASSSGRCGERAERADDRVLAAARADDEDLHPGRR